MLAASAHIRDTIHVEYVAHNLFKGRVVTIEISYVRISYFFGVITRAF